MDSVSRDGKDAERDFTKDIELMDVKKLSSGLVDGTTTTECRPATQVPGEEPVAAESILALPRPLKAAIGTVVTLCLTVSLVHVLLVFLHVAPPNSISQRYSKQINSWVYPLFEQNWRLFAPNPESVNYQISARTARTSQGGAGQVSEWFDLTAIDDSAVQHSIFPSHTEQNMLRRAWSSYLELHGGDDQPHSRRAGMMQQYLSNIAAQRVAAYRHDAFGTIQLRVITQPIAAPEAASGSQPAAAAPTPGNTRYLPWWKVTPHAN
ncbi:DUF5819 family protein [Streptomyces sp. H27-D2]|uniref:DUF5819 family protein n=1 Tax=Streptomyces sp. H27-D2 TaxID=3046304 RepID=UPI002DBF4DBF|nr:DUF5819 family protein [Streptomyces sp. H27-D2]MEC4017440.1 DUF5819 family protein [Streptomyces sp. H27-D2]